MTQFDDSNDQLKKKVLHLKSWSIRKLPSHHEGELALQLFPREMEDADLYEFRAYKDDLHRLAVLIFGYVGNESD